MSNQLQITGGAKVRNLQGVITGTSGVLSSVPLGGANGVATLDSGGKVPVSQLPSSVVTYLGTWDASTNTPTLTNGTGDAGDMYICNVAGTVNFGAGPITFAVGDWVLYGSGTWQKSNGQNGTVTSVAVTESGDALTITGSPITTAGTINIGFAGTGSQYIKGDGTLATFPTTIDQAKRLITEVYNSTGATLSKGTVVYINGGQGNLPTVTKAQANNDANSAQTYGVVQSDITNNNNGYVVVIGSLTDLDTSAYAVGTQLYLSGTTAGAWTSTKPSAPIHLVYVAVVVRSHPTQGVVEIRIQNGYELEELHDVAISAPVNNQGIFYNSSNSLWENKSIATALGYTPLGGSGTAGNIPYYTATNTLGSENGFMYDSSTNRLGVNTTVPNATIGANISIDSGYGLIVKNSDSNYNGIGIGIDSTYGNLIEAQKLGSAPQRNLTLLNNAGYVSVDGYGNLGVNILTPVPGPAGIGGTGIDIYSGSTTAASIGFHTIYSGTSSSVGAYLSLNSANSFILRNSSGAVVVRADGDLTLNTFGYENLKIDSTTGKIGIGAPASITERLTVNGSIRQTGSISAIVKTDANGVFGNATASVDYVIPSDLSNYVPTARKLTINGVQYDLSNDRSWTVGNVTGSGGAGRVAFWDTTSNLSNNALFVWDDVNYRMGIGLNNPQRKLEIYSPAADTHLRISGSAPSVSMGEAITGSIYQAKFGLATAMNQFVTGSVAGDFVINNQTGSTIWAYNSTEKMRLDTSGNLGIGGTATTNYRLQIFAPSPILGIESTTTGNMFLRFSQTGAVKGSLYWINSDKTLYLSNNEAGIKFVTSAANPALTLDSTGAATFSSSVGIGGLSPFANSLSSSLDMVNGAGLWGYSNDFILTGNAYYNGGWTYKASSYATRINGDGAGGILFSNASSGTAGAALTWNNRMFISNTGNVGIGTSSPSTKLTVYGGYANFTDGTVDIYAGSDGSGGLFGTISNHYQRFITNNTERMRITSGGNVGIGTSSPIYKLVVSKGGAEGIEFDAGTITSGKNYIINYNRSTGSYIDLQIDSNNTLFSTSGFERMRITSGGAVQIGTTASTAKALEVKKAVTNEWQVEFTNSNSTALFSHSDGYGGYIDTGATGNSSTKYIFKCVSGGFERFVVRGDGYFSSIPTYNATTAAAANVNVGSDGFFNRSTSSRKYKTDIKDYDKGLDIVNQLRPVYYKGKNDGDKIFAGLIAEEVHDLNLTEFVQYADDGSPDALAYQNMIALLTKAIQEQQAQIEELKALINK